MYRKTIALMLVLMVILGLGARVGAEELPDENRSGSLTIQLSYDGDPLDGGMLTICRVGRIEIADGNSYFVLVDPLTGGPSLDDLDDPDLAAELAELADEMDLTVQRGEIVDGTAAFLGLKPGLYVVTQRPQDVTEGFDVIRPFLLSLPQWIDETYVYDLTAAPKVPLETEPTVPTIPSEPTEPDSPIIPELPQTGQLNWPVPILTILGLSFFTAGWILCFRHRREANEA